MKNLGSFVPAKEIVKNKPNSLIMLVYGGQKNGKTTFALNTPDPILVFDFDHGLNGIIEKYSNKDILVARYEAELPPKAKDKDGRDYLEQVQKLATPVWERFVSDWHQALRSEARTIVLDTASAAFSLGKMAYLGIVGGKLNARDDPFGQKSGAMTTIFQNMITSIYNHQKNLILLAREREVWVDNAPGGVFEPDGWKSLPYEVEVVARISRKTFGGKTLRKLTIVDSRISGDEVNGLMFTDDETNKTSSGLLNFASVASVITNTDPSDWA